MHRGLGVHISFVRSISMDAFKASEIERMRRGGNENWRQFFESHESTKMMGITWDDSTIQERYSGEVGEEWKERLSCKVEGREYVPGERKPPGAAVKPASRTATPLSGSAGNRNVGAGAVAGQSGGKVKVDDGYFARLGADNASRPDHLPPSQGGKYAGFGSTPAPAAGNQGGLPNFDDVQKDPMAALTKGFGWFTSTVSKTAKNVNDGYIQPTAKQVCVSMSISPRYYELSPPNQTDCRRRLCQACSTNGRVAGQAGPAGGQERPGGVQQVRRGPGQQRGPRDEERAHRREQEELLGRVLQPGGPAPAGPQRHRHERHRHGQEQDGAAAEKAGGRVG